MRAIVAAAILLLCLSQAAPEPAYSALDANTSHLGSGTSLASIVATASSEARSGRVTPSLPAAESRGQNPAAPVSSVPVVAPAPAASSDATPAPLPGIQKTSTAPQKISAAPQVPLDDLCNALLTSAEDNGLPVAFFANLIWQESRLRDDAVSPKGALGIAQFMPKVAVESGLQNPLDPRQALSASARMLRELRDQFGNLGFVAAAYNAGAKRVKDWLQRGRTLPRETRGYVLGITGRSVEQWQKAPLDDAVLQFTPRLPCRDFPAFAELEQTQQQQAKLEHEQAQLTQAQQSPKPKVDEKAKAAAPLKQERVAEREHKHPAPKHEQQRLAENKRPRALLRHQHAHLAARERIRDRHEAKERIRRAPEEQRRRA
jgi:soluble lytic murein transglycosylase-like protein